MEVLKVDELPFPVLLGRDTPKFEALLRNAINPPTATLSKDEEAGPSNKGDDDDGPAEAAGWSVDLEFQNAQSSGAFLAPARRALALKEDIVVDERRVGRLPRFEQVRGVLWRVAAAEKEGGTPRRQLLVPLQYRTQVLRQVHGHPWAGHQGRIRTLSWVLGSFFWPSVSQDVQ